MYESRIKDDRVPAYRVIKGQFRQDAEAKAAAQRALWEARWKRMQASDLLKNSRKRGRSCHRICSDMWTTRSGPRISYRLPESNKQTRRNQALL